MEKRNICELCTLIMGQSPDSKSYNNKKEGLPFFQGSANFGAENPIPTVWCTSPKKVAEKGDILISVRAPIGDMNIANEKCCIGRGLAAIRLIRKDLLDRGYLYNFLESVVPNLQEQGTGSTFKAINKGSLESIIIHCPPLQKQQEISQNIVNLKNVIGLKRAQLSALDDLVNSRFIELFGDPVTNSKGLLMRKGSEFFSLSNGKFAPKEKRQDKGIPAYGGNGISWYTDEILVENDTIVIGRVGFQSGNVHFALGPLWVTDNAMYISNYNIDLYDLKFLCTLMEHMDFTRFQDAGDLKKITQKPFMQMEFISPPIQQQRAFISFVEQIDKSKHIVQKQIACLQELLDSKMQEYFG